MEVIFNEGRLDLNSAYLPETGYVYYRSPDNRLFTHWGLVSSFVHLPSVIVGRALKSFLPFIDEIERTSGKQLLIERFLSSMLIFPTIMLANAWLLWYIVWKYIGVRDYKRLAFLVGLSVLGTQLLKYSSGFEEGFMILLMLLAIVCNEEVQDARVRGLAIGIVTGLAMNARYVGFPVFAFFFVFQAFRKESFVPFALFFALGALPYVGIAALYNYARYGGFGPDGFFSYYVDLGYSVPNVLRTSLKEVGREIILKVVGSNGVLLYNPVLSFSICGAVVFRNRRLLETVHGRVFAFSGAVAAYYIVAHSILTWGNLDWASWGPRYLTTAVPFLFLLAVPTIVKILDLNAKFPMFWKGVLMSVVACSLSFQLLSAIGWDETETYQGKRDSHLSQRLRNIWTVSTEGNPLAPHLNLRRPLFEEYTLEEETNVEGVVVASTVSVQQLYEGLALWPVTVGYVLKWPTWKVLFAMMVNAGGAILVGYMALRTRTP